MKKLALMLTIALVGVAAWSQSSSEVDKAYEEITKEQLAGVSGFFVSVSVSPDSLASLLPISLIQTDVELKLRLARIPVLTLPQILKVHGGIIIVSVDGVRSSNLPLWAISLREECRQWGTLDRNPTVAVQGLTWVEGDVVMYGESRVSELRGLIKDKIDKFLILYLAANP